MTNVTVLDGGMGQELIRRAGEPTSLWSIKYLIDAPELVREVHLDYFRAGADVAITNSYSVLPNRLAHHGMDARLEELTQTACALAAAARDTHGSGSILGSLGPLGFSYRPELAPPLEEAAETYARCARIQAPMVDAHILETMSSPQEARGGLMGASTTGKPVWLAISVDDGDGRLFRSGDKVEDVLPLIAEFSPAALLINCSRPEAVSEAVKVLAGQVDIPLGAYANGFTEISPDFSKLGATVDALTQRSDLNPEAYLDFAREWVADGACLIGGCCEVAPEHIALIARHFKG